MTRNSADASTTTTTPRDAVDPKSRLPEFSDEFKLASPSLLQEPPKKSSTFLLKNIKIQELVEEDLRRQYLIRLVVGVIAGLLLLIAPIVFLLGLTEVIATYGSAVALFVVCAICLFLNERNHSQLAAYVFVTAMGLRIVLSCFSAQTELIPKLAHAFALCVPVVVAGLSFNAVITFGYATLVVVLAITGIVINKNITIEHSADWFILVIMAIVVYMMAIIAWGTARVVRRAFINSEWQNQQLLEYNQNMSHTLEAELQASRSISKLSTQLSQISREQSIRSGEQVRSITSVTSTLEELSATARQVAATADDVHTATERALRTAQQGGEIIQDGISSIETVRKNVENIASIAAELGLQSRRIEDIVDTISELADETNLLALNATIEASGAGEYGRRFAVVANEVQNLANRSRSAARDVYEVIGQVKNSISKSLIASENGLAEARDLSEGATQTSAVITEIIQTVQNTTQLAQQIHITTQQQRSATDQAVSMSREVASVSLETASRAAQLLGVSEDLNNTAATLNRT
jgi:methyl-accepting chemotaxis protein